MDLKTACLTVRQKIRDLQMKKIPEPFIIAALNEGKDELVKIIRQANENFFQDSTGATISATTAPNYSILTLPTNFSELKEIRCTDSGYESTSFKFRNQQDPNFRQALLNAMSSSSNDPTNFYYDFIGNNQMAFAPPAMIQLNVSLEYIKTIPDMVFPSDWPTEISTENSGFIITWAVTECMRETEDERLQSYLDKLTTQRDSIIQTVNTRQIKEPTFVRGFLEDEEGF